MKTVRLSAAVMPLVWTSGPQIVAQLIERGAEPTGGLERRESKHRIVALLDRSVMLLHPVVQVLVVAMLNLAPHDPANGLRVGRMLVCRQTQRLTALRINQAAQESPGGISIAVLAEHGVEQVAVSVDGSVEVAPTAADFDVGLVQVPRTALQFRDVCYEDAH